MIGWPCTSRFRGIAAPGRGGLALGKRIAADIVVRDRKLYWDLDGSGMVNGALTMLWNGDRGSVGCCRLECTGWLIRGGGGSLRGGGLLPLRLIHDRKSLTLEM